MGDVEGLVYTVGIVNAGDGDGLYRVPVAVGEGQCATDGRRRAAAGGRDGDVAGRLRVQSHGVGLAVGLSHGERGGREAQAGGVIVGGGEGVGTDSDAAVVAVAAGGGMADGRRAVAGIVDVIVNAGDGDGLCGVPVRHGERQCATDDGRRFVAAGGGHGHAGGRFAAEDDVVDRRIAVFIGIAAGGRQGDTGSVVVVGGHAHAAGDAAVAAAAGGMGDVEGLVYTVVIVNAGDGDGLCRAKVAGGEAQRGRTDGRRSGVAAGGRDGDFAAGFGIEDDGVGLAVGLSHGDRVGGQGQAGDVVVGGGEGVVIDRDAAVAATAGGMADGRGAVAGIDDVIVNAGDGDALCRAKVAGGEGQRSTDGGCRLVATGGRDGDGAGRFGVEDDGVGRRTVVFSGIAAGGQQDDGGSVVVGGGEGVVADRDAAVAAAAGGMADGRGAVAGVVDGVVNAGDGDGLCGVPVRHGERQCATDGRCRAGVAGGRDGDGAGRFGVEDDGVGRRTVVFSGIAAGGRQGDGGGVVVGGGKGVGTDSDAAVVAVAAGGGMADGRRAVAGIVDVIVNAGDGDGLCGVPVRHGERQCATDDGRRFVAAGGGHGHAGGRFAAEDDVVDRRIAVFSGTAAGGRQGDGGGVVVGGGEGEVADRDAAVVATADCMADGRRAVAGIVDVIVNAGDGDGLCGVPVRHGERQCATDGGRREGAAGGGHGHAGGRLRVEHDGVLGCAAVFSGIAAGGQQDDGGAIIVGGGDCHAAGDAAVVGVGAAE